MCLKNLLILAQTIHEIYRSKAVGCGIFDRFFNFNNCQPEVFSDVISGMVDQDVGVNVCANFGDSRFKPSGGQFRPLFERR